MIRSGKWVAFRILFCFLLVFLVCHNISVIRGSINEKMLQTQSTLKSQQTTADVSSANNIEREDSNALLQSTETLATDAGSESKCVEDKQKKIVIWSYWRSGSSFLGNLLTNSIPDEVFYSYEPLHMYGIRTLTQQDKQTEGAVDFFKKLLLCQGKYLKKYLLHTVRVEFQIMQNFHFKEQCLKNMNLCSSISWFENSCQSVEVHLTKILRLDLNYAERLLQDPDLKHMKIVYLIRDPRPVFLSRTKQIWCTGSPSCIDPKVVCKQQESDFNVAKRLQAQYEDRFFIINYEEFSKNINESISSLWKKLELPLTSYFSQYLNERVKMDSGTTTGSHAEKWKTLIPWSLVKDVQQHCQNLIELLGEKTYSSPQEMKDSMKNNAPVY